MSKNTETNRVKEYRSNRIKEGKAYPFNVLINDEEIAKYAKQIPNKSEFLKKAIIKEFMNKEKICTQ